MNYGLNTPIIRPTQWIPEDAKPHPVPVHTGQQTQDHRAYAWLLSRPAKPFMDRPTSTRKVSTEYQ